jgi:hypothetical protein
MRIETRRQFAVCTSILRRASLATALLASIMLAASTIALGQSLNWEGQTGIFVTPLAYTVPSSHKGFGMPVVSYHYLDAGDVLGGFHQMSVTVGMFQRVEFGYTRTLHQDGSTPGLSALWSDGFNTFHAKLNFITESMGSKKSWRPAVSMGFVARSQVRNVGGVLRGVDTSNADFYLVATKSVTQFPKVPLVFNFGVKATNASLLGLAGNAPGYSGRLFGAGAFVFRGPKGSTLVLGSEFTQQPRSIQDLPGAVMPTTITYALRIVPAGAFPSPHGWGEENPKLTIDIGLAQAAGNIMPGVRLNARHQFALGISYQF